MVGRKRNAPTESSSPRTTRSSARVASQNATPKSSSRRATASRNAAVPDIYREMLVEARDEIPARPAKRRRPGEGRPAPKAQTASAVKPKPRDLGDVIAGISDDEDLQFEDVPLPAPTVQTMERDSDDEDDDDIDFEEVDIQPSISSAAVVGGGSKALNLDLSAHLAALIPRRAERRKAIGRDERQRRVEVHKMHLVCLLAHAELRNRWCNDSKVQDALRPLLPQKTVAALLPRASLNQFSRSESLKKGLQEAKELFKLKFAIAERGLRRALWAEDEEQLKNVRERHSCPGRG